MAPEIPFYFNIDLNLLHVCYSEQAVRNFHAPRFIYIRVTILDLGLQSTDHQLKLLRLQDRELLGRLSIPRSKIQEHTKLPE